MKPGAACLLTAFLLAAAPAMAQRVSLHARAFPLEQIFTEIRKQTGLEFLYQQSLLANTHPVTIDVREQPVDLVLKLCLQGQGLSFSIRSGTVVIFASDEQAARDRPSDTPTVITGQVTDTKNLPVPMASIVLLHTRAGTQTDRAGSFSLRLKPHKDTLIITCIGFKERRVPLDGSVNLQQLILQPADNSLDESIVVAYGTTSDRYRTGAISAINELDIERSPAPNALEALAGKIPGLYVRQDGGNPINPFMLQLRGDNILPPTTAIAHSIHATDLLSKPTIVIDGIPIANDVATLSGYNQGINTVIGITGGDGGQDDLYWLNPNDVESISVLKDANSTALYGSRAANGVVLITTKKGKPGKTSLRITASTGVNTSARHVDLMNTKQFLAMRHEAWNNDMRIGLPVTGLNGVSDTPNAGNSYDFLVFDTTRNTDWQKFLLGSAPVYNAGLELTGGEGGTAYRLSANYNDWESSFPAATGTPAFGEKRGTFALNTTSHSEDNRFKAENSLFFTLSSTIQPAANVDNYLLELPDAPPVFDARGNIDYVDWRPINPADPTPTYLYFLGVPHQENWFTLVGRTSLSYELFPSLVLTFAAGYSRRDGKLTTTIRSNVLDPQWYGTERGALFGNGLATDFDLEPSLRYTLHRGRHYLELLAGASYQDDKQQGNVVTATGYTSDAQLGGLGGATSIQDQIDNFVETATISALAHASYRWNDAILLDLSGRRDGSSTYGPGRRYGNFWSVGAGWIFTESSWAGHIPGLTFGKLRGSYGITGIQNVFPYVYSPSFTNTPNLATFLPVGYYYYLLGDGTFQGSPTLIPNTLGNSTLHWPQAAGLDLGADLYFLADQRLKLSLQWYRKTTGDQLVSAPVSAVTGVNNDYTNWPARVRNSGVELSVDYASPKQSSGIGWTAGFNFAANRNSLVSFRDLQNDDLSSYLAIGKSIVETQVVPSTYSKRLGIWWQSDSTGQTPTPYNVNSYPTFIGGAQASLSYKGFCLSVSATFVRQKGYTNLQTAEQPGELLNYGRSNQLASLITKRHWQSPADSPLAGAFHAASLNYNPILDVDWGDASYLAVKNATLTYTVPQTTLKHTGIGGLSLYIRSDNLLLLSLAQFKGFNPEQNSAYGTDGGQIPLRRTVVAGFNLKL